MTASVRVRARAQRDLEEAAAWYETQRPGLGSEFLDEAQVAFGNVAKHPTAYPELYRATRRAVLRRFPFCVYYRISGDTVVVVAVLHGSRHPLRWMVRT